MIRHVVFAVVGAALVYMGSVVGQVSVSRRVFDTGRLAELEARVTKVETFQNAGFQRELELRALLRSILSAVKDIYSRFGEPVEG